MKVFINNSTMILTTLFITSTQLHDELGNNFETVSHFSNLVLINKAMSNLAMSNIAMSNKQ